MESLDIQAIKVQLSQEKREYHDIVMLYSRIKADNRTIPEVERQTAELEDKIRTHSTMIANYEDLNLNLRNLEYKNEDSAEQGRRVRGKLN